MGALIEGDLEIVKLLVDAGSKLSKEYYQLSEYLGEEFSTILGIAYERTLN